jgi:hypothetical protein
MLALCQGKEKPVEPCSTSNKNDVICHGPQGSFAPVCGHTLLLVIFLVDVRRPNWHARFYADATVEPWQTHPVTEGMRDHAGVDISGTEVYEGRKEAEERGVCELEQRAEHGHEERDF